MGGGHWHYYHFVKEFEEFLQTWNGEESADLIDTWNELKKKYDIDLDLK